MKEEKLFYMVENIDDDLICEMMDYSANGSTECNVCEGTLCLAPKNTGRKRFWKYSAATAILVLVMGTGLFIINSDGILTGNTDGLTDSEQECVSNNDNTEVTADIKETSEEFEPPVSEPPMRIIPDKVVALGTQAYIFFTNQYPDFSQPDLSEAYFTEMSVSELFEYYEIDNVLCEMEQGRMIEVTDENLSHGIYTFPDGNTYDINAFTFIVQDNDWWYGKKFTMIISRNSRFGQEFNQEPDYDIGKTIYYDEEKETFFMIFEKFGSCIMFLGKVEELTDFNDLTWKKSFYERAYSDNDEFWQGVPCELELFLHDVEICILDRYKQN